MLISEEGKNLKWSQRDFQGGPDWKIELQIEY